MSRSDSFNLAIILDLESTPAHASLYWFVLSRISEVLATSECRGSGLCHDLVTRYICSAIIKANIVRLTRAPVRLQRKPLNPERRRAVSSRLSAYRAPSHQACRAPEPSRSACPQERIKMVRMVMSLQSPLLLMAQSAPLIRPLSSSPHAEPLCVSRRSTPRMARLIWPVHVSRALELCGPRQAPQRGRRQRELPADADEHCAVADDQRR